MLSKSLSYLLLPLLFFIIVEVITFSLGQSSAQTSSASLAAVVGSPSTVASVSACSTSASVTVGVPVSFMAVPRDAYGNIISGIKVNWSAGTGGLVSVSSTGVVTGIKPGVTSIAANYGNVTDRICLVVTAKK